MMKSLLRKPKYIVSIFVAMLIVFSIQTISYAGVSDRTPAVRDAIVAAVPGVNNADDVTEAHLAAITSLILSSKGITTLKDGDFDGLTALTELYLSINALTGLPSDVFNGLTALTYLDISRNALLTGLPSGVFDGLTALTTLNLSRNALTGLPEGVFNGLTALTRLELHLNALTGLPSGVFNGLTALTYLNLSANQLTGLPSGVFDGLTALTESYISGNPVDPIPLTVSLEKVGTDQFKAVTPTGAPFDIVLPVTVWFGSINGGATSITIPKGSVESSVFTVTRTSGSAFALSVDIGTLPELPSIAYHQGYSLVKSTDLPLAFSELGGRVFVPVSDRTPAVRDVIIAAVSGVNNADDVTEAHLAAITSLILSSKGITTLKEGDFDGLTALTELYLSINALTGLPSGVFNGLTALTYLDISRNALLTGLPSGVFDGLTALTTLNLSRNALTGLPEGVFNGLTALTRLELHLNALMGLPSGVFNGLTALTYLNLSANQLTGLPSGVFDGLTALTESYISGNPVDPIPLTVSLEKVGTDQFKAVTPTGAPFDIVLPVTVWFGSINGGATSITIPKGSVESSVFTVTRTSGSAFALSVDIGTLPELPSIAYHQGYSLVKSTDLPLAFSELGGRVFVPVSDRTPAVRDAIVAAVSSVDNTGVNNADDVTEAHLAAITSLILSSKGITTLKEGDFDGLTALTELYLSINALTGLPSGVFNGLTALTYLDISRNALLTGLPSGVFDGLTALTTLNLSRNALTGLPEGVFNGLTALTRLELHLNALMGLPSGVFNGLTALTYLNLSANQLTGLPSGVFDGLTALTESYISGNPVDPIPLTVSLEKVGTDQFKAVTPTGAPFDIVLPVTVRFGSINGGATSITIPKGSVESETLTVTHTSGSAFAVSVDIGTLPELPSIAYHQGYSLVKSTDLPLAFSELGGRVFVPVSDRTPAVRDAIVAAVSSVDNTGVNNADDVTEAHLAAITSLILSSKGIATLKEGDFDGLTALTELYLSINA